MPTNTQPDSRFAVMTGAQVIAEQARLLKLWAQEDAERRQRNAAILSAL
jgi:hypothetical protein